MYGAHLHISPAYRTPSGYTDIKQSTAIDLDKCLLAFGKSRESIKSVDVLQFSRLAADSANQFYLFPDQYNIGGWSKPRLSASNINLMYRSGTDFKTLCPINFENTNDAAGAPFMPKIVVRGGQDNKIQEEFFFENKDRMYM